MNARRTIRQALARDLPAVERIVRDAYGKYVERIGQKPGPMLDGFARVFFRKRLSE